MIHSSYAGPPNSLKDKLTLSHPFTHQIDVLISHISQENLLQKIESVYHSGRLGLSEVLDACHQDLIGRFDDSHFDFIVLADGHPGIEDVWCIDHRGLLTLLLTKETYQQLGLVGEKASKKSDLHYVQVDLHDRTSSAYTRARERIRLWDERRKAQGILPWFVHIHGNLPSLQTKLQPVKVQPRVTTLSNIFVPILDEKKREFPLVGPKPKNSEDDDEDEEDEANERIEELFEWVGMACMDSGRLKANDRPNTFVAQYEAPQPNKIGSATHIRWSGLLGPSFVKQVLETSINSIKSTSNDQEASPTFLSITANIHRNTPVSYISPKAFGEGVKREVKMGRWDRKAVCWSLILKPLVKDGKSAGGQLGEEAGEEGKDEECEWILASVDS